MGKKDVNTNDGWVHESREEAPVAKKVKAAHSDGRIYFSYAEIHGKICSLAPRVKEFKPDLILAIGEGVMMIMSMESHEC